MTPAIAWKNFVGTSEEMFLSNFRYEVPDMNIEKMCRLYAQELPIVFEYEQILFSDTQIEEIEGLLLTHLSSYIEKKGGLDKLDLYTEEELDEMLRQDHEEIMEGMTKKFGASREEITKALRGKKNE